VYLSLISTRLKDGPRAERAPVTYISASCFPYERLKSHNREVGYRVGAKSTKGNAGKWGIEMVLGPFRWEDVKVYKALWRRSKRSLTARIQMGLQLAKQGIAQFGASSTFSCYAQDVQFVKKEARKASQL